MSITGGMGGAMNSAPQDHMYNPLVDMQNKAASGWIGAKTADTRVMPAVVNAFYPDKMKALVTLVHAGLGSPDPILVDVRVKQVGGAPGSGEAFELVVGHMVDVNFLNGSATGLYNQGTIDGQRYTDKDQTAPKSTTWLASGGKGRVYVDHDDDGNLATTEHHQRGNKYTVQSGDETHHKIKGSKFTVAGGDSTLRAEDITRKASEKMRLAVKKLGDA